MHVKVRSRYGAHSHANRGKERTMGRILPLIFIVAFATITGIIITGMLTVGMTQGIHMIYAAAAGFVISAIASWVVTKRIAA